MSERWKPKVVHRMRQHAIAKHGRSEPFLASPSTINLNPQPSPDVHHVGQGSLRITLCRHNMPWRDCLICSKPVKR